MLADLLTIYFFQQRLALTGGGSFLSAGSSLIWLYLTIFLSIFGFRGGMSFLIDRFIPYKLNKKAFQWIIIGAFLRYGLPFPQVQVLGIDLPERNVLDYTLRSNHEISLSEKREDKVLSGNMKKLELPEAELERLAKKKQYWLSIAKENPDLVFQTFDYSPLKKLTDEYGNSYVFEVFATAVKEKPDLAFTQLSTYQDWRDEHGKSIIKPLLKVAIEKSPELAFRYLDRYQLIVEDNEKIAKSLLTFALQNYKDPLSFWDLFQTTKGRSNKKNLILVFLESASVVDSHKFWGLNNRLPKIDKVSDDGISFTQMYANGTTSEMGHIATLLGVEPLVFSTTTGSKYQNFKAYTAPLAKFFNQLGYVSTFLSTASLDFLWQKDFINYVGYQKVVGPEAFSWKKHYTFDAAPDEDLYSKAIEIVKNQTSPFFLTLQTISSHLPYNTPYGKSEEAMYRYEDETFSKFYQDLKTTNFFENGILVVIGDHRKMVPLEDSEFEKWGPNASSKIVAFAIWKGLTPHSLNDHLYQQTDLFYSLLSEFATGEVKVRNQYNDLFTQKIVRDWALKHAYDQRKANLANSRGEHGYIDLNRMKVVDGASYFPSEELINYLKLSIAFQEQDQEEKSEFVSDAITGKAMYLISHRWDTTDATENSLNAFRAARDALADGLEFDVNVTKDGKLVVFHGPKMAYTTSCRKETRDICEMNRSEVQKCPFKDWQTILTLEEALSKIKNWFPLLFLDFKTSENPKCKQDIPSLLEQLATLIQAHHIESKVIISSYNQEFTKQLWTRNDLLSALDTHNSQDIKNLSWSNFSYFMTDHANFTPTLLEQTQLAGVDAVAYTVNSISIAKKLKEIWVRFIMTDKLKEIRKALEN